jgi:spermidine synthase
MIRFYEIAPFVPITYTYEIDKIHYKAKSAYQEIMVIENPQLGKMLILDGIVQLTEKDEFFYHEMITHVAMHAHPNPKKVVVIGGGDGGTSTIRLKRYTLSKLTVKSFMSPEHFFHQLPAVWMTAAWKFIAWMEQSSQKKPRVILMS